MFSVTPSPSSTFPTCGVGAEGEGGGKGQGTDVERQKQVGLERGDMGPHCILPVLFSFDSNKDPTFLYV